MLWVFPLNFTIPKMFYLENKCLCSQNAMELFFVKINCILTITYSWKKFMLLTHICNINKIYRKQVNIGANNIISTTLNASSSSVHLKTENFDI